MGHPQVNLQSFTQIVHQMQQNFENAYNQIAAHISKFSIVAQKVSSQESEVVTAETNPVPQLIHICAVRLGQSKASKLNSL